jgi:hypothetical protein
VVGVNFGGPGPPSGFVAQVVDGQPDTFALADRSPSIPVGPQECSAPWSFTAIPVVSGNIVVTDAQPRPSSKDQCKNGGWRTFGVFKDQGDCVSYVATKGKNPPANTP